MFIKCPIWFIFVVRDVKDVKSFVNLAHVCYIVDVICVQVCTEEPLLCRMKIPKHNLSAGAVVFVTILMLKYLCPSHSMTSH